MYTPLRRGVAAIGAASIALTLLLGAQPATGHPTAPPDADEQHAIQDLVGTPMDEIEAEARATAQRIEQTTGQAPGGRTSDQQVTNQRASSAAAADPGQGGQWSAVRATPVVPVFQVVLPNGKVLLFDSVGDNAVPTYPNQNFTRAGVWDPRTNTWTQRNVSGYNIFCAGYVQLSDGRVFVAGGNKNTAYDGIVQTHIFDWRTERWSRGPNMSAERWYPSVAALGNGEALIVGGGSATAEVYQRNGRLRRLTGFSSYANKDFYPFLVPRPDGSVELVGPYNRMDTMRTSGSGALAATRNRDGINRIHGSFATYDIGKVLVAGGGSVSEGGQTSVPTRKVSVVNVGNSGTTSVSATNQMSVGRRLFSLTVLADGSVLATGGQSRSDGDFADLANPVFAAERWDPATGRWSVLASARRVRQYHSAAALLPDGRVMTGGGGICADCQRSGYLEKNVEYFSPPYLFRKDGSGAAAPRPVISSAPITSGYARRLAISTPQASSIRKVGMVRLGAPTHGDDQGQRYIPLKFGVSGSVVSAAAPATPNIAPPGYYMLFITDSAGVPSVAKIVKLDSAIRSGAATPSDYNGDGTRDLAVWRPSNGTWYVRGVATTSWGLPNDKPVPGDYNGDRKSDLAVYRASNGTWYVKDIGITSWGLPGDKPVPGDYNGDGKTDLAVYRPSNGTWYVRGVANTAWGKSTDIPVPADYNGDGKTDLAVWRPSTGTWYIKDVGITSWGLPGDSPALGDYNGDEKSDLAVWRASNGTWYVKDIGITSWGLPADKPVPGDYNGDRKADLAVWRASNGTWYVRGIATTSWGANGDVPV
jgi:hypothetical protein